MPGDKRGRFWGRGRARLHIKDRLGLSGVGWPLSSAPGFFPLSNSVENMQTKQNMWCIADRGMILGGAPHLGFPRGYRH